MRRLILGVAAACAIVALTASGAPAKNGNGVMCVLHAKLRATSETTGSTSTAKGHTQIKVRANGTIEFKTHILNKNGETFVAGHITRHRSASPVRSSCRCSYRRLRRQVRATSGGAAWQRRTRARPAPPCAPTRAPITSTTTRQRSRAAQSAANFTSNLTGTRGRARARPLDDPHLALIRDQGTVRAGARFLGSCAAVRPHTLHAEHD